MPLLLITPLGLFASIYCAAVDQWDSRWWWIVCAIVCFIGLIAGIVSDD